MNFGIFDADWDIKTELLNTDTYPLIDGTLLDRNGLKAVSYRTFFTKSFEDSYNKYKNACEGKVFKKGGKRRVLTEKEEEKRKALPIMSETVFKKLYDNCQKLIGGSEKYVYTIFYIESLIECRVIYQMLRKRYEVRNVYDCFYFKSSQTTETEIKQIVTNCAIEVYKELKQPSLWW